MSTAPSATPVMQQFQRWKKEYPDALLFFRMGDFYELFYDDAKVAAAELGITLTARSKGAGAIPMAGVPVKSYQGYLHKLVRKGFRIAICDQIQDPREAKGLVDRAVVRVVSAGTLTEENLLEEDRNNYLLALLRDDDRVGLAWVDLSTGRFVIDRCTPAELFDAVARVGPSEILAVDPDGEEGERVELELERHLGCQLSYRGAWDFAPEAAERALRRALGVQTLEGFGIGAIDERVRAAGALATYLEETQKTSLAHLRTLEIFRREDKLLLDRSTRACLELTHTLREGRKEGTLLAVLDDTLTAMGARLLREWLLCPLCDPEAIRHRQDGVAELLEESALRAKLRERLRAVQDLERLAAKISTERASARDLLALRSSLRHVPELRSALEKRYSAILAEIHAQLDPLEELTELLERALDDDPPTTIREGGMIRAGFDTEIDELRELGRASKNWIARFEEQESQRSSIPNLRVGFNRVFGYYIEVTRSNLGMVPQDYIRKQTLKNAERFITPELKEYETRILKADELVKDLEYQRFLELRAAAAQRIEAIQSTARALARLDVLATLAEVAARRRYVAPQIELGEELEIEEGRHPVIEVFLPEGDFVPNDLRLDLAERRMAILTGPNMSGKSTYIRQAALIVLMAQIGSFVPAARARIGVVDRIFTRIGAADDLARGSSTFMVEMVETANILNNATRRSLVILDEVGRGTSTFDGLSIAWAVCEHLHEQVGCRTLFATHYHELTDLPERFHAIHNLNVAVHERGAEIVFLHRIAEGGTDRSYGIHVARLAGIPPAILQRAQEILESLEDSESDLARKILGAERSPRRRAERQLSLFEDPSEQVLRELAACKPDQMTPIEALLKLRELQGRL